MQSQAHSRSQYAAVPLPQHPHPPPPPLHPPSYRHYPHSHTFAAQQNGGALQQQQSPLMAGAMPGQNGMMRFGIPLEPGPMGAGGSHKKDIKRRTKTGCLTCRKRRIKCDEGHPTCRNCQKSKRECLGYDPVFKQQSGTPAPIQPAPAHPSPGTSSTRETASPAPGSYYTYPLPGGGIGGAGAFAPPPTHTYSQPLHRPSEHAASLDPALGGNTQSPLIMAASDSLSSLYATRIAKPIAMNDLFALNDVPPKFQIREAPSSDLPFSQREIDDFYRFHFAQGLDRLFETRWYSSRGLGQLRQNPSLLDFVTQCMIQFRTSDPTATAAVQSLEAQLVWQLAVLPRSESFDPESNDATPDQLTNDVLPRIDAVEYLLTGQYLPTEKIPPPPSADQHGHTEYNERHFWHQLATFASARDDSSEPRQQAAIDGALNAMRAILGMMENRDVLYSLAIARHIGGRIAEFHPRQQLSRPDDPYSEIHKLEVARHFVEVEDQRGTTQVIQRICGMAMRSWTLQKI